VNACFNTAFLEGKEVVLENFLFNNVKSMEHFQSVY
jgi:hypothetical protein